MANRIEVSTEALETIARSLRGLESSLAQASDKVMSISLPRCAGGELEVGRSYTLSSGRRVTGDEVKAFVRSAGRAADDLAGWAGKLADNLQKIADLCIGAEEGGAALIDKLGVGSKLSLININPPVIPWESIFDSKEQITRDEYYDMVADRADHAIDPEVAALYRRYQKKIKIGSDTSENGYYSYADDAIYFDWEEDVKNVRGQCTTYFHEVGHLIDDRMRMAGDASSSRRFTEALRDDFNDYVLKTMRENSCSREEAYEIISEWLWEDADQKNGLSDLCGGLSGKQCEGKWSHSSEYWNRSSEYGIAEKLNNEAFAHFFEACMATDSTKLDYLKEVFPTAYQEFKGLVREKI